MAQNFTKLFSKVILFLLITSSGFQSKALTNVGGVLSVNTTFNLAGSPYIVTSNLIVTNGVTLTINPGVTVKFNQDMSLLILGQLLVNDSILSGVTFTANSTTPTAGFWGGITFGAIAVPATYDGSNKYLSGSILNNVNIEYAGSAISTVYGAIAMTGTGVPYIRNARISNCAYNGIYVKSTSSKLIIKRCDIQNCNAGTSNGSYTNNAAGINILNHTADVYIDSNSIGKNAGAGLSVINTSGSVVSISNNRIYKNVNLNSTFGGGIYADAKSRIFQNQIFLNSSNKGGGIATDTLGATGGKITNNLVFGNSATEGAGTWGAIDSITNNVFSYNSSANEILKSYQRQYNNFNQFIGNTAPVVYRYFGGYNTAVIKRNSFSNNKAGTSSSSLLKFDGTNPGSLIENNLMLNNGYTYYMHLLNNNNTVVVPAQNCFWRTAGPLTTPNVQSLIFDINNDINQGQISFQPYQLNPRTDCPISGVTPPLKVVIGDSLLVYWGKKTGENIGGYKIYYGGSNGLFFTKVITTTTDTFCKISVLENIDTVGVLAYTTGATQTITDYFTGAQSWITFADWANPGNPTLSSFSPSSATAGDIVTINGTNFTGTTVVKFGGTPAASFIVNSAVKVSAVVARGSSGNVFLTAPNGSVTLSGFTYIARPHITFFTPTSGNTGDTIRIHGFHFTTATLVKFGITNAASFTISGDTMISAIVGSGSTGQVLVNNPFGMDTLSLFSFCTPFTLNLSDTTRACGDSVLLSVTPGYAAYLWNTGNSTSSIYAKLSARYNVMVTNSSGCISYDTTRVILSPYPTPAITGRNAVCALSTGNNYKTPNGLGHTFVWNITGGVITSGAGTDSIFVTWGAAGAGTLSVSDSVNATGCKSTTPIYNVTINPNPSPVISGEDSVCSASTHFYKTARISGHTYNWTVIGGIISSGQGTDSITVLWGTAGNRNITVVDSINVTGCKATSPVFVVRVFATPNPFISGTNNVCEGSTGSYSVAFNVGRSYFWTVSSGGTIVMGQGTWAISVIWSGTSSGTVTVRDSVLATGCKAFSSPFNVTVNPTPNPVISGYSDVCTNSSTHYTSPAGPGRYYFWEITGGVITAGQGTDSIEVTWGSPGIGILTVLDSVIATGCKAVTPAFNVTIHDNPTPAVTGPNVVCAGGAYFYTTPDNPGSVYEWAVIGGTLNSGNDNYGITVVWGSGPVGSVRVKETVISSGCNVTSPIYNVTILEGSNPVISGPDTVCSGNLSYYTTPKVNGHIYKWTISGGLITFGQGTDSIRVTWGAAGTGVLTVMDSVISSGCYTITEAFNVKINDIPTPVISGSNSVCSGSNAFYSTTGSPGHTYLWSVTGGSILFGQGSNFISISWGAAGSGSVIVMDSINATGCNNTSTPKNVTINATPNPLITGLDTVCSGSLTDYKTPRVAGHYYVWNITGGTISSGQGTDSIRVTWGVAGTGTITVRDSVIATGCKVTTPVFNVGINDIPTPVISGLDSVCSGNLTTYTTPGNLGHTYTWTVTGGIISFGQGSSIISVTWGAAGSGTVKVMDSINTTGCKVTTSNFSVTINTSPAPVISGNNSVCSGTSNSYSTPAGLGRSYLWVVTGGAITAGQGTRSVTVLWVTPGLGTLNVTDSVNATGCKTTTLDFNVTIVANPTPVISGNQNVCTGGSSVYSTPFNPGRTYFWTVTGGVISSGQGTTGITVNWGSPGAGTVTVSDSVNSTGCKGITAPYSITILANPNPVITGPVSVCTGSNGVYSTVFNTGRSYNWTVTGGTIVSGQGTSSIIVTWSTAGSGTLLVSDSIDGTSCKTTTAPFGVTVNANPTPNISGSSIVCAGVNTIYSTPYNAGRMYSWTITNGNILAGQGTNSVIVIWSGAGLGTLTVSDSIMGAGCITTTPTYLVSIIAGPSPVISGPPGVCSNTNATYSTPANAGRSYNWIVNGGTIISGQGTASIDVKWGSAGTGSITVMDSVQATGCKITTAGYFVSINTNPASIVSGGNFLCANGSANYGTMNYSGANYVWTVTGGTINSGQGTSTILVNWGAAGTGNVSVNVVMNVSGCTGSSSKNVTLNPLPSAFFNAAISGGNVTFMPVQTGLNYKWLFGDGDSSVSGYPTHTYLMNGTYTVNLHVSTMAGCPNDSSMEIVMTTVGVDDVFAGIYKMKVFPNPYQRKTTIAFILNEPSQVELEVFDMMGRLVQTIVNNEELQAGSKEFEFDSDRFENAASVYMVRLKVNDQTQVMRIIETE